MGLEPTTQGNEDQTSAPMCHTPELAEMRNPSLVESPSVTKGDEGTCELPQLTCGDRSPDAMWSCQLKRAFRESARVAGTTGAAQTLFAGEGIAANAPGLLPIRHAVASARNDARGALNADLVGSTPLTDGH